jgi:hypothetical protein
VYTQMVVKYNWGKMLQDKCLLLRYTLRTQLHSDCAPEIMPGITSHLYRTILIPSSYSLILARSLRKR